MLSFASTKYLLGPHLFSSTDNITRPGPFYAANMNCHDMSWHGMQ
jgi:hypothetical protein